MDLIKKLVRNNRRLQAVEHAVITAIIVAGTIGMIGLIVTWVNTTVTNFGPPLP